MMSIHLSPRLAAIAALVPDGARVIDVGTDHGMIPVYLAQEERASHVYASDIREGPLRSCAALVRDTGMEERVSLRLADGLNGFTRADADTVIIAGMGGETIAAILGAAPWLREDVFLILSPHTKQEVLRRHLTQSGFAVRSERLVLDAGRIYPILTARAGGCEEYTTAELYTGRFAHVSQDPLLPAYLDGLMKRAGAAAPFDPAAAELLRELRAMKERCPQ